MSRGEELGLAEVGSDLLVMDGLVLVGTRGGLGDRSEVVSGLTDLAEGREQDSECSEELRECGSECGHGDVPDQGGRQDCHPMAGGVLLRVGVPS